MAQVRNSYILFHCSFQYQRYGGSPVSKLTFWALNPKNLKTISKNRDWIYNWTRQIPPQYSIPLVTLKPLFLGRLYDFPSWGLPATLRKKKKCHYCPWLWSISIPASYPAVGKNKYLFSLVRIWKDEIQLCVFGKALWPWSVHWPLPGVPRTYLCRYLLAMKLMWSPNFPKMIFWGINCLTGIFVWL